MNTRRNPSLIAGSICVGIVVLAALVSCVWTPYDPLDVSRTILASPSPEHWLGTDEQGRDIFSRLLVGARSCLLIGVVAVGIGALIGVPLGIIAASGNRWIAAVITRGADIVYAFPAILLAILFAAARGSGSTVTAMVAIGISTIPTFVRLVRAETMQILSQDYVAAARLSGITRGRIGVRHVLPNIVPVVLVQSSVSFSMAILAEASLSYLGLGTPATQPSWGRMIFEAQSYIFTEPILLVWPGVAIALAVLGFNLLGDGLRDRLDPTIREVER